MIRLAVFDLDGTLVNSRRDLADAANALVMELRGTPLSEAAVGDMVGEGAGILVRRVLAASGLPPDVPGALDRFLTLYDERLLNWTRAYEGVEELLEQLSASVALAVLTNKPQAATERLLAGLNLAQFFNAIIGGDTRFGRKPDPAGLHHLMSTVGAAAAEALLVGDSPIDLETARRAGTRVCIARYGFGFRPVELRPGEALAEDAAAIAGLFERGTVSG